MEERFLQKREETKKALNKLLQGENMAKESMNIFISKIHDQGIKSTFQQIQRDHRDNAEILANYLQDMGGEPDENLGMKGDMADMKIKMDLGSQPYDKDIVKEAIEGETKGINMAEKVLRGNLDDKARELAGKILAKDRESLNRMRTLM